MRSFLKYLLLFIFGFAHVTDGTGSNNELNDDGINVYGGQLRCPSCAAGNSSEEVQDIENSMNEAGRAGDDDDDDSSSLEDGYSEYVKPYRRQKKSRYFNCPCREKSQLQINNKEEESRKSKEDKWDLHREYTYNKFRCDYKYCSYSQAFFKYHVVPLVWKDARLMCTLEGAILASPTTPEIKATMTKSTGVFPIFTGLHSRFSKGKYFTVDGIPLESIPHTWAKRQPNNLYNNESCIASDSQGQFADVRCDEPRPFMCYRSATDPVNECGTHDPEYRLDVRTKSCYKFHTVPRNFERAHFACAAEGGHLAIINSPEEATVLRELFVRYPAGKMVGNFWKDVAYIGVSTWGEKSEWRTIHGQTLSEAGYDKWSPGEPNNSTTGEYCGSIYRTAWLNDLWCDKFYAFICEKRPDYPPICDYTKAGQKMPDQLPLSNDRRNYEPNPTPV